MIEGVPKWEHLAQVEKQTGRYIDELHPDEPPNEALHVWGWYRSIRNMCDHQKPIPPTEYEAWIRLKGLELRAWEIEAMLMLDRAFISHKVKQENKQNKK